MDENKPGQTKVPTLSGDWVIIYRLHRERVTQEDTVTDHRMTWMLWSQTILFGLWGGLFAGEGRFSDIIDYSVLKFFEGLLCVAGAIAAYGSYRSVDAATQEIERIKCLYEKTKRRFGYAKAPEDEIFGMVVGKDIYHKSGHIVTHYGPVFFILVWLLMLFVFVLKPWIWKLTPIPNIIYQGPGAGP